MRRPELPALVCVARYPRLHCRCTLQLGSTHLLDHALWITFNSTTIRAVSSSSSQRLSSPLRILPLGFGDDAPQLASLRDPGSARAWYHHGTIWLQPRCLPDQGSVYNRTPSRPSYHVSAARRAQKAQGRRRQTRYRVDQVGGRAFAGCFPLFSDRRRPTHRETQAVRLLYARWGNMCTRRA